MRKLLALGPLPVLCGVFFACQEDPSGGGPDLNLDGSTPTFDSSQQPVDGSATPDAPPGAVTVTITSRGGPKADVLVVFHDTTGAVLETKLTGADGKATSTGKAPAMASALLTQALQRHIVTWTGVENGDELTLDDVDMSEAARLGQFNVTLPGQLTGAGAVSYEFQAGACRDFTESTTAMLDISRYCELGAKGSVLVSARDSENRVVGHSFKKGNTVPADGGVIDVATSAWAPPTTLAVSLTNLPSHAGVDAQLLEIADGYGYRSGSSDGLESVTFTTAKDFADACQASVSYRTTFNERRVIGKRFAPATAIAFDLSQGLPPITGAEVSDNDARRPVLTWTSTSTAAADGGLVRTRNYALGDARLDWTFVVAPGTMTITAPAMPPEAESFLPAADAGPGGFQRPSVVFFETDSVPSYAAFRRQHGMFVGIDTPLDGLPLRPLPANGTYRATAWFDNPG